MSCFYVCADLRCYFISLLNFILSYYSTVQASIPSNTYVITGNSETKRLEELLPGSVNQLGPESMDYLRSYSEIMKAAGAAGGVETVQEGDEEDEDEVPDLVENFEEAAAK